MKQKFAIPTENGKLCAHFGHCEKFVIVDTEDKNILAERLLTPPVHQPGVYPRFLAEQGVHVIIAGGMGQKAQDLFAQNNIKVIMGIDAQEPADLVKLYLNESLESGANLCDH